MKTIVIGNIAENDLRRSDSETLSADWQAWVQASHKITDRAFFWEGSDKIVITSHPYDSLWMSDMQAWLGLANIQTLSPARASDYICDDILADASLMAQLQNFIADESSVKLTSWGSTKGMNRLLTALQTFGNVDAPELMPDDKFDLGLHFDSKSGFRQLCEPLSQIHPQVRIPFGIICEEAERLIPVALSNFIEPKRPFVIKSDYRSGGSGILIYRPKELAKKSSALICQEIEAWQGDGRFFPPPYIVEEYIPNDEAIASQLCYHGRILPDGQIERLGACGTLIENEGYKGSVIGDLIDPAHIEELIRASEAMGAAMFAQGYYGRLNIDFVVSEKNELYTIEINAARRGGSVHVYEIFEMIQEHSPEMTNLLTYDHFVLPAEGPLSYQDVRPVFQEFRENPPVAGALCLPILVSPLKNQKPHIGYMIVAPRYSIIADTRVHLEEALCRQVQSL